MTGHEMRAEHPTGTQTRGLTRSGLALQAAMLELERHVGSAGWDQPPRLFALVHTDDLIRAEPDLANELDLRGSAQGAPPDALTAVEQDGFDGREVLTALTQISWPDAVFGCAVALEQSFLPAGPELSIPDDPTAAAEFVAQHPRHEDIRVAVGVDREGNCQGVARLASQPGELLGAKDLVPALFCGSGAYADIDATNARRTSAG